VDDDTLRSMRILPPSHVLRRLEIAVPANPAGWMIGAFATATCPPGLFDFRVPLLLSEEIADAVLGDLNERFEKDCRRYGEKRARLRYWGRGFQSLWLLLRRFVARAVKWAVLAKMLWRMFSGGNARHVAASLPTVPPTSPSCRCCLGRGADRP
jgi:hypothetical protein